jgi:hypothetical protein
LLASATAQALLLLYLEGGMAKPGLWKDEDEFEAMQRAGLLSAKAAQLVRQEAARMLGRLEETPPRSASPGLTGARTQNGSRRGSRAMRSSPIPRQPEGKRVGCPVHASCAHAVWQRRACARSAHARVAADSPTSGGSRTSIGWREPDNVMG